MEYCKKMAERSIIIPVLQNSNTPKLLLAQNVMV